MTDITEIKRRLNAIAQSVAEHLLPQGRKEGSEWRAGSVDGERGQSLGVHLTGSKAGVWSEFNGSDKGGDLLDLWCAARRLSLPQALDEARSFLGMTRPEAYREPTREYTRPARPKCTQPEGKAFDYLTEDRNIPAEVLTKYKIAEANGKILFPFLLPDGELALVKARKPVDGEKPVPTTKNCEPILFGWQAIPDDARECVITEGEIDALSMAAYGYPSLSVPFGGGGGNKQRWIENEFERMERFEKIYLALDMDKPGDEAAAEIASRLGRHRCLRVKLPCKDGNQCLVEGISKEKIDACIQDAEGMDPEGLRMPSAFTENVLRLFWPIQGEHVGYRTPYRKLGEKLLFRPAELTLWSGDSGAGKSQLLSDCVVDWVHQGSRVCLASLEMKGEQTLKRMVKQAVGVDRPTEEFIARSLKWLDQGLLIYDRVGKSKIDGLLDVFNYARAKYGCDQFIIDSLMRLGVAGDDYTGQEKAVYRLVDWVIENSVHLHLVAHAKKGDRDRGAPRTSDVKGAMEIGANAFNIVTVWRNKKHEDAISAAETDEEKREIYDAKPGVIFNVDKQRNGDFEGKVGLWFDQASYRYRSSEDRKGWGREYISRETRDAA